MSSRPVLIVIPTLSNSRSEHIISLHERLSDTLGSLMVFANGKSVSQSLHDAGVPTRSTGVNTGFAGGVNGAAADSSSDVEWIVVMNDDIEIDDLAGFVDLIANEQTADLIAFGDEPLHIIPGRKEVFLSVSMLAGFVRKRTSQPSAGPIDNRHYAPFSLVAIRRSMWLELGGLDERYPFSSEDADFGRRALTTKFRREVRILPGIRHIRGETGRANIERVLPAAVWGGYEYLRRWECNTTMAKAICLAALTIRIPLVVASRSSNRSHLRGIQRAMRSIAKDRRPQLPEYHEF